MTMFRRHPLGTDLWQFCLCCILAGELGCNGGPGQPSRPRDDAGQARTVSAFQLKAKRLESGGEIPKEFTCDGVNASPKLTWVQPPTGTQSFALIMQDSAARAGSSVH